MEAYIDLISRPEGYMDLNAVPEPAGGGVALTDTTPYLYRISADGQNIGSQEFDEIVGGTVAWNQQADKGVGFANLCTKSYDSSTGETTVIPTNYGGTTVGCYSLVPASNLNAHKYLLSVQVYPTKEVQIRLGFQTASQISTIDSGKYTAIEGVLSWTSGGLYLYANLSGYSWESGDTYKFKNVQAFDLTQMFGATIADYIYSLETSHAGDGVAFFRKFFNKPYYAYNSGELISSLPTAHETVGFNQWDEEWELGGYSTSNGQKTTRTDAIRCKNPIRVLPNTTYYFHCGSHSAASHGVWLWYDSNDNYIGVKTNRLNRTETSPSNVAYLRFYVAPETTYNNDICINISDASKNGTYEPYISHSYPLDSSLTLRGIPKLVDNKLYYDGDIYQSDGTVTRKYGLVDLGTLSWTYVSAYSTMVSEPMDSRKMLSPVLCTRYVLTDKWISTDEWTNGDKLINSTGASDTRIRIKDTAYTNAATFKTAMSGVYLVYELATPTSESATPYTNPQIVAKGGTEEYVDSRDVPIPVGHNTKYQGVLL